MFLFFSPHIKLVYERIWYEWGQCDYVFTVYNNLDTHDNLSMIKKNFTATSLTLYTQHVHLITHIKSVYKGIKYNCNQ